MTTAREALDCFNSGYEGDPDFLEFAHGETIRKALRVLEMVETLKLRDRVHYNAITGGQIAENATNQGWNDCLEIFKQIAEGKENE